MSRWFRVSIVLLLTASVWVLVDAKSNSINWVSSSPFENSQMLFNPYTLGLPSGAQAPIGEGISYAAGQTLVVVINRAINPDYVPLIASWAELPDLQVVVIASNVVTSSFANSLQWLFDVGATVIRDPLATILATAFHVGERTSPVSFLVDQEGVIAFRRRGFADYQAFELDRIVREFAAGGRVPVGAVDQHVLWYGDIAPWPQFPVSSVTGEAQQLLPGRPRIIYFGYSSGNHEGVFNELTQLGKDYPEIELIWLRRLLTDDSVVAIWEYAHAFDLVDNHPEAFDMPIESFLENRDPAQTRESLVQASLPAEAAGWTVLFDLDGNLARYWCLCTIPSVFIIDADGTVCFPNTLLPIDLTSGEPVLHPLAIPVLTQILDELLNR